jgi:hypothetical protein
MAPLRQVAVVAGALYLVTHVTSIPAVILYAPLLSSPDYVVGPGVDSSILLGALLEIICALAIVGTGVTLFPVVKRQNESFALGYVALRTLEAGVILVGVVCLLGVITLRQQLAASANPEALKAVARALVGVHDWTFLVGPNFVLGTNTVLLAYLMYASRLVPRWIGALGLVGGALIFASAIAELFGLYSQISIVGALTAVPVFGWELSLAFWLIIKGFKNPRAQTVGLLNAA